MRVIVLISLLLFTTGFAQRKTVTEQDSIIEYGTEAIYKALNFIQGNRASLVDAQDFFSAKGWESFLTKLNGWLDGNGAPKYTSNFKQGGKKPKILAMEGDFVLTIYGDLKQKSRNEFGGISMTTYSVAVSATISKKLLKIDLLEEKICGKSPCD